MKRPRDTSYLLNAYLAIALGLALIIGETIRRFGNWGYWARWMDDYFMALFLIIPAILVIRKVKVGRLLLIAGWSFNIGILYVSFFHKLNPNRGTIESNINEQMLITLIGMAFVTSIMGLIWLLKLENQNRYLK